MPSREFIESEIHYETRDPNSRGITFNMCRRCDTNGCRGTRCADCWRKALAELSREEGP